MGDRAVEGGLEVVFDPAIDSGSWPGPGHDRAVCGEAWLGPLGLLGRLELELGLGGSHAQPLERELGLAGSLRSTTGFWTASFEADPLATARRLLADRDILALWGWRGEPASERLASLWAATSGAPPGIPDRLHRVIARLARRRVEIATVRVIDPIETLPPLWQEVFAALQRSGVRLVEWPLPSVAAAGDLGAARSRSFAPIGDGSLQLVQPHGPLAAAEEVAAALAASNDLCGVVVIGPDVVLDHALVRHGLPRLGADDLAPSSSALVRLCIETAFEPMNARDLHALLCADPGPVPRGIARRLAMALGRFPGRRSTEWREALADGLDAIATPGGDDVTSADLARRRAVETRLAALLDPVADRTAPLATGLLAARMGALVDWARGRVATEPSLREVIGLADRLLAAVSLVGVDQIGRGELRRLCAELERPTIAGPRAELGLASVSEPGAILAPVRVAVWWGFGRDRAAIAPRIRLSAVERAALYAAGVRSPEAGTMMAHEARRWRRPMMLASEAVVLVCPRTDEAGEPAHLHPLWDELIAALPDPAQAARLHAPRMTLPARGSRVAGRRERAAPRTPPAPASVATASRSIELREAESASSIEQLLACSLAYALHYPGRLRSGMSSGPAEPTPLLFGNLTHFVLSRVFAEGTVTPDAAAELAAGVIDAELPLLAETLMLPDHQAERATVRRAIIASARAVADLVARSGATIRGLELSLEGRFGPANIKSRADLVLADPDHVIDFKWGESTNRDRLRAGAAVQLAIYAELSRTGPTLPGAAYLIARNQRLLAARGTLLSQASVPTAHAIDDMLHATRAALEDRVRELAAGDLVAPSAIEDAPASLLADGVLRLAPACAYCELDALCGRRGRT